MTTYIILLRGINVSGQKKIKMSDLRTMLQKLDFSAISTYIQSGNIVLKSDTTSPKEISQKIKEGIYATFGYDVPVLVNTIYELKEIIKQTPFEEDNELETKKWYYVLLQEVPNTELASKLQQDQFPNEQFIISGKCVYLSCGQGYGNTKCNNNYFEKKLKVSATTRNYRTMLKLLEMAEEN